MGSDKRPPDVGKQAASGGLVMEKQAYEIQRLQMENRLLRDFLRFTGGR